MVKWGEIELPGFDAPLVAVATERRNELAVHVRELVTDLKAPAPRTGAFGSALPDEPCQASRVCALCRGSCCRTGGNTAYLNPKTMTRFWSEHAHLTEDQLVATYLHAVPDRAFDGSCIFHTAHGCNLPLAMRSNVCMTYQCTPLRNALSAGAGEQG